MNRHTLQTLAPWVLGLILIVWFIGRYRGTWFGDPVLDRFLGRHDGDIVAALKEAENPRLNEQGEIIGLHLDLLIRRNRLPSLRYSNAALRYVKQVPSITTLTIGAASGIDDRGMVHVAEMTQLETLGLNGLPITDTGLSRLHSLKNLQLLTAYATRCTQDGINAFQQAVPNCEIRWGPQK